MVIRDKATDEDVILCQRHVDVYCLTAAYMPPSDAIDKYKNFAGQTDEVHRNKSKTPVDLQSAQQQAGHSVSIANGTFRWRTGLNILVSTLPVSCWFSSPADA